MKAICNLHKTELVYDYEVGEWACMNCGYLYDEYTLVG